MKYKGALKNYINYKGGGVSEKKILDYVGGGRGLAKDDG